MAAVVAERSAKGRFRSLADFAQRLDARLINKRQVENLACAGAFDGLSPNRAQAYHAAEIIVRHASAAASERDSAQVSLFGGAEASSSEEHSVGKEGGDRGRSRWATCNTDKQYT